MDISYATFRLFKEKGVVRSISKGVVLVVLGIFSMKGSLKIFEGVSGGTTDLEYLSTPPSLALDSEHLVLVIFRASTHADQQGVRPPEIFSLATGLVLLNVGVEGWAVEFGSRVSWLWLNNFTANICQPHRMYHVFNAKAPIIAQHTEPLYLRL